MLGEHKTSRCSYLDCSCPGESPLDAARWLSFELNIIKNGARNCFKVAARSTSKCVVTDVTRGQFTVYPAASESFIVLEKVFLRRCTESSTKAACVEYKYEEGLNHGCMKDGAWFIPMTAPDGTHKKKTSFSSQSYGEDQWLPPATLFSD